jgi:prophage maintenance system killer protein
MNADMLIYQAENGALELQKDAKNNTIWATQKQLAQIFDVDVRTINEHLQNIFAIQELSEISAIRKFRITASDGKKYNTLHYNLDVIISVGYRVNSKTATKFRQWATKTLRQHITEGYTLHPSRLRLHYDQFTKAIADMGLLLPDNTKVEVHDVLNLVQVFAQTWFSLDVFDKSNLPITGAHKAQVMITATMLEKAVVTLKADLVTKQEATDLFAQEKNTGSLAGIVGNVLQGFGGNDVYPTLEEKAAHLLYFIIKDHPFNDGNKRTAAFAFVWFLLQHDLLDIKAMSPEALTVLTLLIAESNPRDKERMIGLVLLLLGAKIEL